MRNFQTRRGESPQGTLIALDPRQEKFLELYFSVSSPTFGNCYQSAISAGYTTETARNLMHNRPKWLSEKLGQMQTMEPELLLLKLTGIINDRAETTQNKLRAIDMMMKHYQMFGVQNVTAFQLNIQSVLD
ncbi:hypothetical protein JNM87_02140 [Candidatus Saccharibacteria bacterium]|nr:hypothetical protein [Candidatus Saccharibacteria bacterium]